MPQKPAGTRNFFEQHFAAVCGREVAAVGHQQLLRVLADTVEQAAAGDSHFGGEPADRFHSMGLAQPVVQYANGRQIFDAGLNEI